MSAITGSHDAAGTLQDELDGDTKTPVTRFHFLSYFIGLLTALTLVGGSVFLLRRAEPPPIALQPPPTPAPTATPAPTPTPGPVVVYVSGAVAQPGVYPLAPSARIGDAIAAAGGFAAAADPAAINQAQPLFDGAQVHIPPAGEQQTSDAGPLPGLSGAVPTPTAGSAATDGGLVNLNTATAAELEALPGIGASKAAAIIADRPFQTVDDLDRVPGIGASLLDRLRPLVTID